MTQRGYGRTRLSARRLTRSPHGTGLLSRTRRKRGSETFRRPTQGGRRFRRLRRSWDPIPRWFVWPDLPANAEPSALPAWLDTQGLRRYERSALASLWRSDLLSGGWVQRFERAPAQLVDFINDFHSVPGYHLLVRHCYGGAYRRSLAQLALRVIERLASRNPEFARHATIEETLSVLPTGDLLLAPELVLDNVRYRFLAWRRIHGRALLRLLQQSAALHPQPTNVRWVFDGKHLRQEEIIRSLRRALDRAPSRWRNMPAMRAWGDNLERVIRIV